MGNGEKVQGYWDSYYRQHGIPELPSQFALFVANEVLTGELAMPGAWLDIGCGNGRDSLFFAQLGFPLGALDRSEAAIALCRERLDRKLGSQTAGVQLRVGSADSDAIALLAEQFSGPLMIYSRFFFHAIDEATEALVIDQVAALLQRRGGTFAVEYRTLADAAATKVTSQHYRRFIDPEAFADRVSGAGLDIQWRAEGRGMAKFRADDAHVARLIATS